MHTFAEKTVGATIQYLRTKQINRIAWDNCVENATMPFIYGHSWYLDIVSPHWEGIVWQRNGVYLAVMPLPIRVKHGYRALNIFRTAATHSHFTGLISYPWINSLVFYSN